MPSTRPKPYKNPNASTGALTNQQVLLQPGHKWNNIVFHNHTGLKTYPNYMMGGGYVVSGDVSRTLVDVHSKMR